jgi:hypothetical protein
VFQENTPTAQAFEELVRTFVENVKAVKTRSELKV